MTTFTVTELENAYMCGWKHDFNSFNRLSLESSTPLKALWLGTLVHKALDLLAATLAVPQDGHAYFTQTPEKNVCDICGNHIYAHFKGIHIYQIFANEQLEKIKEKYKQDMGTEPTYMELKETHDTIRLGRAMFQNYLDYYKTPLPDTLEYISTEQSLTVDIPGTEHCACAINNTCTCITSCRPYSQPVHYTHCQCVGTACPCRQFHKLEGTLDGLVRRKIDNSVFILENKTFTFHPKRQDLLRNHQFMGYTWAGNQHDLNIQGVLYNGLWKREKVPNNKTMHDLFTREYLDYTRYELESWEDNTRELTLLIGDPNYIPTRNVPPVGGCNGVNMCSFKDICDARFKKTNYDFILASRYTKRERTSIFAEQESE